MTNPNTTPATTWNVTGQQEGLGRNGNGPFEPGITITFELSNGAHGQVFVPIAQYSPDNVRAIIAAKVATMVAVHNLSGQVSG